MHTIYIRGEKLLKFYNQFFHSDGTPISFATQFLWKNFYDEWKFENFFKSTFAE